METLVVGLDNQMPVAVADDVDEKQLLAFTRGRTKAFRGLVERYKRRAYYVALGLVGSSDDAWDLSQEAFIRVWKNRRSFDPGRPFWPWFYSVLANLCKNWIRDREVRTRHTAEIRAIENSRRDKFGNPEAIMCESETQREVWDGIQRLPFKFREIIILRHFQDMPYEQIARQLGIPEGSVMSRLYYARKKLREVLENPEMRGE